MFTASLPASDVMLQKIAQETAEDPLLQRISDHIQNVRQKGVCPQFYSVRAHLRMANGLVPRQNRIAIPHSIRQDMLQRVNEGHLGVEKCKRRAREAIYWAGINEDIEDMTQKCDRFQKTLQTKKSANVNRKSTHCATAKSGP